MLLGMLLMLVTRPMSASVKLEMLSYYFLLEGQLSLLLSIFTNYSLHLDQLV